MMKLFYFLKWKAGEQINKRCVNWMFRRYLYGCRKPSSILNKSKLRFALYWWVNEPIDKYKYFSQSKVKEIK